VDAGSLRAALALGQTAFGENRVAEASAKARAVPGAEWHMVGHLQTNKVADAARLFDCVHSVDSLRLARRLSAACEGLARSIKVLVQVDLAGEVSKHGVRPDEAASLVREAAHLPGLEVAGLMTIPPWAHDSEDVRRFFHGLARIADATREATGLPLPELSMGMSNDFEVAIEEGATLVRVGRAIFGERPA
jgi:pyridoxal phosphate enzyme (YggS family)